MGCSAREWQRKLQRMQKQPLLRQQHRRRRLRHWTLRPQQPQRPSHRLPWLARGCKKEASRGEVTSFPEETEAAADTGAQRTLQMSSRCAPRTTNVHEQMRRKARSVDSAPNLFMRTLPQWLRVPAQPRWISTSTLHADVGMPAMLVGSHPLKRHSMLALSDTMTWRKAHVKHIEWNTLAVFRPATLVL